MGLWPVHFRTRCDLTNMVYVVLCLLTRCCGHRRSRAREVTVQFFFDTRNEFDPERVNRLSCAFKAALAAVSEEDYPHIPPVMLRRLVASGIIAKARRGENSPERLKEAGLDALRRMTTSELEHA
jgi:hypothetical protein